MPPLPAPHRTWQRRTHLQPPAPWPAPSSWASRARPLQPPHAAWDCTTSSATFSSSPSGAAPERSAGGSAPRHAHLRAGCARLVSASATPPRPCRPCLSPRNPHRSTHPSPPHAHRHHPTPTHTHTPRRAYLDSTSGGGARALLAPSFSEWVMERRELKFLLSQLVME